MEAGLPRNHAWGGGDPPLQHGEGGLWRSVYIMIWISDKHTSLSLFHYPSGMTRRTCIGDALWGAVDVSSCSEEEFVQIAMEVTESAFAISDCSLSSVVRRLQHYSGQR